jgi:hypothetical protein
MPDIVIPKDNLTLKNTMKTTDENGRRIKISMAMKYSNKIGLFPAFPGTSNKTELFVNQNTCSLW